MKIATTQVVKYNAHSRTTISHCNCNNTESNEGQTMTNYNRVKSAVTNNIFKRRKEQVLHCDLHNYTFSWKFVYAFMK